MNLFQWLTLPVLWLTLVVELVHYVRRPGYRLLPLVRCVIWFGAALAIAMPELTQSLANAVGIHRGADLVFYMTTLSLIVMVLGFYTRYLMLERQITEVVRHVAILEASRNPGNSQD